MKAVMMKVTIQPYLENLDEIIQFTVKLLKRRFLAILSNIPAITLMLMLHVKCFIFVPIIKRTIFFVQTEQYSIKNI